MSEINPTIFRAYDIRGLVGTDLDKQKMELLGKGFGKYLIEKKIKKVVVGRDNRKSSPEFSRAFCEGLLSCGVDVVSIGEITTPGVLFACRYLKIRAGFAISASHNPPNYNGIKFVMDGRDVGGEELQRIKEIILKKDFVIGKKGKYSTKKVDEAYLTALSKGLKVKRGLKVAVDAGNGIVGKFIVKYLKNLGHKVVPLNCKSDPNFPNHLPDTVKPEYYPQLIETVVKNKCDLGLMFDADGDRLAGVDEKGKIVWADSFLILYARDILKKQKAKIVVEIKCSQAVIDDIKSKGGEPLLWKTGRTRIEEKMFQEGAVLGGEMSGHMFFVSGKEKWLSDALYAAGKICKIVSDSNKKMSELLSDIPKYYSTQEYRFEFTGKPEEKKFELMEKIVEDFKKEWGKKVLDIDGARVDFGNGWGLIRVSNGEPVFSLRFEGKTEKALKEIIDRFKERLVRYPEIKTKF